MSEFSRRQFVKGSAALAATATLGLPGFIRARGLNERLQVGFVAVGGRARAHTKAAQEADCQCVAFADVDKTSWGGVLEVEGWSGAKGYTDWRNIFEHHAREVDEAGNITNDPAINDLAWREPREGWGPLQQNM